MSRTVPVHRNRRSSPSLSGYLRSHQLGAFRALLFGGNLLLLIILLAVESGFPHSQRSVGW